MMVMDVNNDNEIVEAPQLLRTVNIDTALAVDENDDNDNDNNGNDIEPYLDFLNEEDRKDLERVREDAIVQIEIDRNREQQLDSSHLSLECRATSLG